MNKDIANTGKTVIAHTGTEQYLYAAFENAFIGMAVADLHGSINHTNHVFSKLTGYAVDEMPGKNLLSIFHPEDLVIHKAALDDLLQNQVNCVTIESRFQSKSMETVWVRNSYSLINNEEGLPIQIMLISVNINEEKRALLKAEEITKRFRFLADSIPQQIWTADADGNLNYFSHSFYEYSGITPDEIKNINGTNIIFEEDRALTCTLWKHAVRTGEAFMVEHRLRSRDGNFTWQLSKAMPQREGSGNIIMWVGTTSNIHRQKTVEEELEKQVLERTHDLQQANFNLKHSNHDLEQFAYIATHDLQEPLRKIRTYSSWINKKYINNLPEEGQDYMLKIENASERMSVLIDDLLNYSLLLRPQEAFEKMNLNLILDHVLNDFDSIIKEKKAVINRMSFPEMKVIPIQIYQLFYNILSNALKFTSDERIPVVEIGTRIISEEEVIALQLDMDLCYIEITFKDNGIGFLQEYNTKIFSIFQRLNSRKKFPGTGIGLALCHKIVAFHHGLIYASSKENEGASFYVLLPL